MANVTGTLKDFRSLEFSSLSPTVTFTASGPAVSGASLFSTVPVVVTPASNGTFTVALQATDAVHPGVWYTVKVSWLDSVGGYVGLDYPGWKLFVPTAGGAIGDLISVPANPAMVWTGEYPPTNPTPGTWWLQASTGELKEMSN